MYASGSVGISAEEKLDLSAIEEITSSAGIGMLTLDSLGVTLRGSENAIRVSGSVGIQIGTYSQSGNDISNALWIKPTTHEIDGYNWTIGSSAYPFKYHGSLISTSDERLKENVKKLDLIKAKDFVDNCNAYSFNFKGDSKSQIGVIAQEIQKYYPEVITKDENGILGVEYTHLIAPLLAVVKDLRKEVSDLKE